MKKPQISINLITICVPHRWNFKTTAIKRPNWSQKKLDNNSPIIARNNQQRKKIQQPTETYVIDTTNQPQQQKKDVWQPGKPTGGQRSRRRRWRKRHGCAGFTWVPGLIKGIHGIKAWHGARQNTDNGPLQRAKWCQHDDINTRRHGPRAVRLHLRELRRRGRTKGDNNNPNGSSPKTIQPKPEQQQRPSSTGRNKIRQENQKSEKTDYAELSGQSQRKKQEKKNNNDQKKANNNRKSTSWRLRTTARNNR